MSAMILLHNRRFILLCPQLDYYYCWCLQDNFNPAPSATKRAAPTVFCYICSRQYGSKSITIHEPQCLEKWKQQNQKLPKHQRRPEPVKPEFMKTGEPVDQEKMNQMAWEASQANLAACEFCGRTFNPDRLEAHNRSCTAENPHRPPPKK